MIKKYTFNDLNMLIIPKNTNDKSLILLVDAEMYD